MFSVTMNANLLLVLLPLAAGCGWIFSRIEASRKLKSTQQANSAIVPSSYLKGLNQLLSNQDDQALKTFLTISQEQPEYPELQLTLGKLARNKGEFERAICIHQSIFESTVYDSAVRTMASYELAKDYFSAGLYDRAESLFSDLLHEGLHAQEAIKYLLEIYQREQDWLSAIALLEDNASALELTQRDVKLCHYYCQLAEGSYQSGDFKLAGRYAEHAVLVSDSNARTIILQGKIAASIGDHPTAIESWKKLQWQEPHYLGEVIGHLNNSYQILGKNREFLQFLKSAVRTNNDPRLLSCLVETMHISDRTSSIKQFVQGYLRENPTLGGVHQLMTNWLNLSNQKLDQDTVLLVQSISKLIENQRDYACLQCGYSAEKLHWQCPACQQWDVIKPSQLLNSPLPKQELTQIPALFSQPSKQYDYSASNTLSKDTKV